MNTLTPEQLAKLPKWATAHIEALERTTTELSKNLAAHTTSSGHNTMDTMDGAQVDLPDNARALRVTVGWANLSIHINDNGVIHLNVVSASTGILIQPGSGVNSINISNRRVQMVDALHSEYLARIKDAVRSHCEFDEVTHRHCPVKSKEMKDVGKEANLALERWYTAARAEVVKSSSNSSADTVHLRNTLEDTIHNIGTKA